MKTGGFQTGIFAAELTPKGKLRRKVRLWRGVSIGPGSTQVIEFEGRTLALYMRRSASGRELQATVRRIFGPITSSGSDRLVTTNWSTYLRRGK
ncbi:MAG: hypothetical protein QOF06_565 [Solirubrobacterales bacterium]|nr:hypothetical protein [Solirubrobacterales bacterium]